MKKFLNRLHFLTRRKIEAVTFLIIFFLVFGFIGYKMGFTNMLNTIMQTSYSLLIETVLYIMAITVVSGALGSLLVEFGVVRLIEYFLKPLMKPLYNLPGVAAIGGIMTFLSDNPAIISLSKDKNFTQFFKKYQLISLTNFGTAFGMGLVVVIFMMGKGYVAGALIGLLGAIVGSIVSTRLMQKFILKSHPELNAEEESKGDETKISFKSGVDVGLAIIPGVLIISTFVMMITFGEPEGGYTGGPYEGIGLLPYLANKVNFIFEWLFGFKNPELLAFPITSLGAVGAALGLIPRFMAEGLLNGNAIAVFTAMGMCWSGFLSTHTAMLDSLGYRNLTSKAIIAHTIGGFVAGIAAHLFYLLFSLIA